MADRYELDLPLAITRHGQVQPGPPLHANQRLHWRRERVFKILVRDSAHWRAKQAQIPPVARIEAQLHYQPGNSRGQFDPSNLFPTHKAALDGVVAAGVVPDDSPRHVTEHIPAIHPEPGPRRLWLAITILETQ